jgi:YgiT-type zinc finger domain-containing protein
MYDYNCEHCKGIVREKIVAREIFKYQQGFVILEGAPIGVCDQCGTRYYHASLLHRVAEVATSRSAIDKIEKVPVVHFA